jgi:hypothetical protein
MSIWLKAAYLEDHEEVVQLPLLRASVKARSTRVEQGADQPNAEEVVHSINGAIASRHGQTIPCKHSARCCSASRRSKVSRTVTKSDKGPKNVEDDRRIDDAIHVQFPEILDGRYSTLIKLEDVFLRTPSASIMGFETGKYPPPYLFGYLPEFDPQRRSQTLDDIAVDHTPGPPHRGYCQT